MVHPIGLINGHCSTAKKGHYDAQTLKVVPRTRTHTLFRPVSPPHAHTAHQLHVHTPRKAASPSPLQAYANSMALPSSGRTAPTVQHKAAHSPRPRTSCPSASSPCMPKRSSMQHTVRHVPACTGNAVVQRNIRSQQGRWSAAIDAPALLPAHFISPLEQEAHMYPPACRNAERPPAVMIPSPFSLSPAHPRSLFPRASHLTPKPFPTYPARLIIARLPLWRPLFSNPTNPSPLANA